MLRYGVCFLILVSLANAGDSDKRIITVDDYFSLSVLNEVAMAPDGKLVAYTEGRWQKSTGDRKNDIWVVPTDGQQPVRWTFDRLGYAALQWSSDGKYLYFATSWNRGEKAPPYDGSTQVWRISRDSREQRPVTRVPGGVDSFVVAADGKRILYSTSSSSESGDWSNLRSQFSALQYGTRQKPETLLGQLDLETWRTLELKKYSGAVDDFSLSPDGKWLAMVTGTDGSVEVMEGQSRLTLLELASGKTVDLPDTLWRKNSQSPFGRVNSPVWAPDGSRLAFAVGFDAYPSEIFVAVLKQDAAPKIGKLPRPGTISLHGGVDGGTVIRWRGSSNDLSYLGDDKGRVRVLLVKNAGDIASEASVLTDDDTTIDSFSWDRDGDSFAAIMGNRNKMHDVSLKAIGSEWKQLTDAHAHTTNWKLPSIEFVQWKSADGSTVEGILELPPDRKAAEKLPLVINIHGGPTSMWGCNMQYGFTGSVLFASQGYAFFSPNYRGSTGYGDEFLTQLVGKINQLDVDDILSGVDFLISNGVADQDRISVAGWSNGGFLTNCLITKTDRFKAASSGAGITDQAFEWGANDEPAFPSIFLGGTPWESQDAYVRASPIFQFGKVRTPTLFHVGANDPRCPRANSEMGFRAAKKMLGSKAELIVYPGEGHGLNRYVSREAKLTWDLAWFDHYLRGRPIP